MPIADDSDEFANLLRGDRVTRTSASHTAALHAAALQADDFLTPGTRVGRYELGARLGSGGMGVVHKAYDPQLSRHVALKFLHHGSTDLGFLAKADEYRERLLREAQALAKLSHPNVVTVFEVGHHRGALFLAMEFIEGISLKAWVQLRKGRRREVLRALIDAGRGLAAAHRAGVLHRDFKLGNVMVSEDGRVRVLDFGLARAARSAAPEGSAGPLAPSQVEGLASLSSDLTQSGTLLGTVGYIAPESFIDGTLDERSDQFSYAEAVFVALTGQHSHDIHSTEAYRTALLEGQRIHWPLAISRRLRRVVERGIAFAPSRRHASLDAMVDALERAARPARTWMLAAAALPIGALGLAGLKLWPASCAVGPDALAGVWDTPVRAQVQQAFANSGKAYADDTFRLVAEQLDSWQLRWRQMKVDACQATRVRHDQSERVYSLRSACLDSKRAQLELLVSLLRGKDPAPIDRAIEAAHEVAPLEECSDVPRLLGESDQLPEDPERRSAVEKLMSELDIHDTLMKAGRWRETLEATQRAIAQADQLGFAPLVARAQANLGTLFNRLGRRNEALAANALAFQRAVEARSQRLIALLSTRKLIEALDYRQFREARAMLPFVAANVELSGDPALHVRLRTNEAAVLVTQGKFQAARAALGRAQQECLQPDDVLQRTCITIGQELANIYISERNLPAAMREYRNVVAAKKAYFGPRHPNVALEYANLAEAALMAGDAEAVREAVAAAKATGPVSQQTEVRLQLVEAGSKELEGDFGGAVELFSTAQPAVDEVLGPESGEAAAVWLKIGRWRLHQGEPRAALAALERAAKIRRDAGTPDLPEALFALAHAERALGDEKGSQASAREALALWREQGPLWAAEAASAEAWLEARR